MRDKNSCEIVIKPERGLWEIDWKELWSYRDLLFLLVRRDMVTRYRRSLLGPLWFILQPCITTALFVFVFKRGLKISTDGIPAPLFYFCGLLPWGYFAQCLASVSSALISNASLFNKVYFPRLIVPFSLALSHLAVLASQFLVFLGLYASFEFFTIAAPGIQPEGGFLLLVPLLILQILLLAVGFGLWVSALTIQYRDFQHLTGFLIQLWMFATPIIYPSSALSERWRFLLAVNPMAGIVEAWRYAFFGVGDVSIPHLLISMGVTLAVFVSGVLAFNKVEQTFVDTL